MMTTDQLNHRADILVVNSNCEELRLLSRYLQSQGFYPRQALNSQMAISAVQAQLPDLVLMEGNAQTGDSYAVQEYLKANSHTQEIPLLVVGSSEGISNEQQPWQLGGIDYLHKPYHLEEIGMRLRLHLQWQRQKQALHQENQKLKHQLQLFESSEQFSPDTLEQIYLLKSAIAATHNGLVISDALQKNYPIIYVNQGFEKMTGYSSQEVIGKNCRFLHGEDRAQPGLEEMRAAIAHQCPCCVTVRNYRRDGSLFWNEISISPVFDQDGQLTHYIGVQTDVSERKMAEAELLRSQSAVQQMNRDLHRLNNELHQLANQDGLTGAANRRCFDDYLSMEWARSLREQIPISLVIGDIDYFKRYNDTYNHLQGDDCLRSVAQTIMRYVRRPADLVARWGGEEFAVILPNTPSSGAMTVAETIRDQIRALEIPHVSSDVCPFVTMSLGVATVVPTSDCSAEKLKNLADQALYLAKGAGRNCVFFLDE